MPRTEPSWRLWPQLRFFSRALCVVGIHHWMMSQTLKKPLACTVCSMKTVHFKAYEKMRQDP